LLEDLFEGMEMADSKNKTNDDSTDDFADDLDAMLNDAESSMDGGEDELIDDEDVIDRLLMDDTFDNDAENNTVDEFAADEQVDSNVEESSANTMAEKPEENEIDEFAEDEIIDSVSVKEVEEKDEFADEDDFDVDSLLDSVAEEKEEAIIEDNVASEDDFDIDDLIDSAGSSKEESELEVDSKSADDDFLMADFDISADDDELVNVDEIIEAEAGADIEDETVDAVEEPEAEQKIESNPVEEQSGVSADFSNELDAQKLVTTQTNQDLAKANDAIKELKTQVQQSLADNDALQKSLAESTVTIAEKNDSLQEEIDTLQKDQHRLKKAIKESESKVPTITYIVMAIAILALLIGAGLGAVGYGAKTDVEGLTELVATLEEEIEIITSKDSSSDVREINFKINELKIQDDKLEGQLLGIAKESQIVKPNTLQPIVDDLLVQNAHAQKAIEKLLAAVEVLEQKVVITEEVRKRALRARKISAKVKWVVNLVSFKQEWYAKRKAEEFNKKGVAAKVERVEVNGETWFRLRVKDFKSKYEAAAYAVKVKKILNLSSVWVTKA